METFTLELDKLNQEKHDAFFKVYEYQNHASTDLAELTVVGGDSKFCRFCFKSAPVVTFKKLAHVIPQAVGNRYLVSLFECDSCNESFSKCELSFTSYMSVFRALARVKNYNKKKKHVRHKEPNVSIESNDKGLEIFLEGNHPEILHLDKNTRQLILNVTLPPYIPIDVYRVFVKVGLSLIDQSEMKSFEKAFWFLLNSSQDYKLQKFAYCQTYVTSVPGPAIYRQPHVTLYTKKNEFKDSLHPQKVMIFFFANHNWQINLPFNANDDHILGKKMHLIGYPLLIDKLYFEHNGLYETRTEDLSGHEKLSLVKFSPSFTYTEGEYFV